LWDRRTKHNENPLLLVIVRLRGLEDILQFSSAPKTISKGALKSPQFPKKSSFPEYFSQRLPYDPISLLWFSGILTHVWFKKFVLTEKSATATSQEW
jgi:hypothetical protein